VRIDSAKRTIATGFALTAFSVALLAGLASGNPALDVIVTGLVCMMVCYAVGGILASICGHVIREHVDRYKASKPTPDISGIEASAEFGGGKPVDSEGESRLAA